MFKRFFSCTSSKIKIAITDDISTIPIRTTISLQDEKSTSFYSDRESETDDSDDIKRIIILYSKKPYQEPEDNRI